MMKTLILIILFTHILGTGFIIPSSVLSLPPAEKTLSADTLLPCTEEVSVTDTGKEEEAISSFLIAFYTSNKKGRYDRFQTASNNWARLLQWLPPVYGKNISTKLIEKLANAYHHELMPYISEQLYADMLKNRELLRFDRWAILNGVETKPVAVHVEADIPSAADAASKSYAFSLVLELEPIAPSSLQGETQTCSVHGQLSTREHQIIRFTMRLP